MHLFAKLIPTLLFRLTAGSQSALIFDIDYNNTGLEEARDLQLRFSGLSLNYFTSVSLASRVS